jgi:hypothetical protein
MIAAASEHDIEHAKSLPSEELEGAKDHEHVKGVGSLPGKVSESGVARLPDDRTPGTRTPAEDIRETALDASTPGKSTSTPENSAAPHGGSQASGGLGSLSKGSRKYSASTQDESGTSCLPFGTSNHETSGAGANGLEKGARDSSLLGAGAVGAGLARHSDPNTKEQVSGSSFRKDTG